MRKSKYLRKWWKEKVKKSVKFLFTNLSWKIKNNRRKVILLEKEITNFYQSSHVMMSIWQRKRVASIVTEFILQKVKEIVRIWWWILVLCKVQTKTLNTSSLTHQITKFMQDQTEIVFLKFLTFRLILEHHLFNRD